MPHIVIVLNATDVSIDERQWDPEYATERLLNDYKHSVRRVPALQELVLGLKEQGKAINTTRELLDCYYSSIKVVRIPTKGRYMQIDEQLGKLQQAINIGCMQSYMRKKKVRMLLNSEVLPKFLNSAYDHFSRNLDMPFDFVEEACRHAPLPKDFGDHILNLIRITYNHRFASGIGKLSTMHDLMSASRTNLLMTQLSRPIAACVILAATRDRTQGT